MKILLVKYRNIGDVLLSSPLIENLKYYYPDATIDFALNDYCESMLRNNPNINNIYAYKRSYYKSLSLFNRVKEEIKYFKNILSNNYDIIINLTEGERGAYISLFSFQTKIKLGYELNSKFLPMFKPYSKTLDKRAMHIVKNDLNFLELLNKDIFSTNVSIYWSSKDKEKVDNLLIENNIKNVHFFQVHAVSRWMFKCWENDRFAKLIDYLQLEKNIKVVLTASPDPVEIEKVNQIISLCKSDPCNLSGKLSLNELAYLSKKSDAYLGIDSAPMHMAAAVNTPVIAMFGASRPLFWGPWANNEFDTYEEKDGIQRSGKHKIIISMNQNIFMENGIKKSEGMCSIKYSDMKGLVDECIQENISSL